MLCSIPAPACRLPALPSASPVHACLPSFLQVELNPVFATTMHQNDHVYGEQGASGCSGKGCCGRPQRWHTHGGCLVLLQPSTGL